MMAREEDEGTARVPPVQRIPPPVPDGTERLEPQGRIMDVLMGHTRTDRRVLSEMSALVLSEDEAPQDPPPSEAPEPVPDGTEPLQKGDPPDSERR